MGTEFKAEYSSRYEIIKKVLVFLVSLIAISLTAGLFISRGNLFLFAFTIFCYMLTFFLLRVYLRDKKLLKEKLVVDDRGIHTETEGKTKDIITWDQLLEVIDLHRISRFCPPSPLTSYTVRSLLFKVKGDGETESFIFHTQPRYNQDLVIKAIEEIGKVKVQKKKE